jgi:hypothetical protein
VISGQAPPSSELKHQSPPIQQLLQQQQQQQPLQSSLSEHVALLQKQTSFSQEGPGTQCPPAPASSFSSDIVDIMDIPDLPSFPPNMSSGVSVKAAVQQANQKDASSASGSLPRPAAHRRPSIGNQGQTSRSHSYQI